MLQSGGRRETEARGRRRETKGGGGVKDGDGSKESGRGEVCFLCVFN